MNDPMGGGGWVSAAKVCLSVALTRTHTRYPSLSVRLGGCPSSDARSCLGGGRRPRRFPLVQDANSQSIRRDRPSECIMDHKRQQKQTRQ